MFKTYSYVNGQNEEIFKNSAPYISNNMIEHATFGNDTTTSEVNQTSNTASTSVAVTTTDNNTENTTTNNTDNSIQSETNINSESNISADQTTTNTNMTDQSSMIVWGVGLSMFT